MKKHLLIFSITTIFAACTGGSGTDKKAELDKLKSEQTALKEKIMKLEAEIAKGDTNKVNTKQVGITEMQEQPFIHYIEVQASVEGDEDVMLSAEAAGTVKSVSVYPGDNVNSGQILAVIDDKMIRQNMSELQSQLDLATQLYTKQKNLWDQKIGSEVQFLQAKTNMESLERRMNVMQNQLDLTRIKAPFSGTVDNVIIKAGQTVSPGMPAIRVVNLTSLKVKGEVAESFINRVKKGDNVILFFPDQNKEVKTKIDYSGSRIDPLNRTFNVEVRLKEEKGNYRPNMICVMKIIDYSNTSAYVVPVGAVQKSSDGEFIYIATSEGKSNVVKRKVIESGLTYNGFTEIKTGLTKGDKVITKGFQNVIEGDHIGI